MPKSVASSVPPEAPVDDLPGDYKAKRCRHCKQWSNSLCPWPLAGTTLTSWAPLLPWGRGNRNKPCGEICKICLVVWDQGGYEAEYGSEDRFIKSCDANPPLLHGFLDMRANVVKLKRADPHMRFRVETNCGPMQSLATTRMAEQGLEAPETFFVVLEDYEAEYGPAKAEDIIKEVVNGKMVDGVNVMTGKRGWHKRINNNKTQVKRTAEFSDGTSIDKDGAGLDKMESAIKKATLKSIKSTITAPNPSAMRCGSEPAGGAWSAASAENATGAACSDAGDAVGASDEKADSESEEDININSLGFSSFLKIFTGSSGPKSDMPSSGSAAARPKAVPKPKAARAKPAPSAPSRVEQPERRVVMGNAGGASSKRRNTPMHVDPFADDIIKSPETKKHRKTDGITEADQATIEAFEEKIRPVRSVTPPVADAPFKSALSEHMTKMTQILQELRVKKKSADRRAGIKSNNNSDMLFLQSLSSLEHDVKEMHKLLKCLSGAAALDADKTLLQCLDEIGRQYNMHFNSAVYRRALKALIYDDLKVCNFSQLVGATYETVVARFVADDDDGESLTCDAFYSMTCAQVLQKLSKNAQSKTRSKESIFSPFNKKETSVLEQFLTEVATTSKLPKPLSEDAHRLLKLLKAETDSVSSVRAALEHVSQHQNTSAEASEHYLSSMLMGVPLGAKLMSDAKAVIDERSVDSEMSTQLEEAFGKLPTGVDMVDGQRVSSQCEHLQEAHNCLVNFMKDKARAKSLGKDGITKMQSDLRSAAVFLMIHSLSTEVTPWAAEAITSMENSQLFAELKCPSTQELVKLQDYATLKSVIVASSALSKVLVAIKSKHSDGTSAALHTALEKFDAAVKHFKEFIANSAALCDPIPENVQGAYRALGCFSLKVKNYLEGLNEKDIINVIRALGCTINSICTGKVTTESFEKSSTDIEQLKLHAASMPSDWVRREPTLEAANFSDIFITSAKAHHEWTAAEDDAKDGALKTLVGAMQKLESYEDVSTAVQVTVDVIGAECSPGEPCPSSDAVNQEVQRLREKYAALETSWTQTMVSEMTAVLDKITTLQIPDTKDLKYDVTDNKILPSLDTHFATLKDLDETVIVDESHRLQKCIERAKEVGLSQKLPCFTQAVPTHANALTALAIIALVKVMQLKRFRKNVEQSSAIPANLIDNLKETLRTCQDMSPPLEVPPALQAQVSFFINANKSEEQK